MRLYATKVQIQKPVFTAFLEKSIAMLLLPHTELAANIEQELQDNPLLEAEFEISSVDQNKEIQELQIDLNRMNSRTNEESQEFESSSIESMMTLEDYLFQQLFWEITDPKKRKIGDFIIGNLDKDGFLHLSCEEIAETLRIPDVTIVQGVLNAIQNFDPIGIATKDLKECLIVQLQSRQSPYRDLAIRIIENYLDYLGDKRYSALSKILSVSLNEIASAEFLISTLEPKPARNYCTIDPTIYVQPDLYIRKNEEGKYAIETNKSGLPPLRISQTYSKLLKQPNISNEDRDFIKEKISNAINFIRSLEQRGETLTAIGRYILDHQKNFFYEEDSNLTSMTIKEVAEHLERCESTISRAINNKYIDTPQGLFPLKFFFSHNVSRQNHENVSAHNVKQELTRLIEEENKQSPLTDQEIQDHFKSQGLHIARRTITKYRQKLNIPASHLRK